MKAPIKLLHSIFLLSLASTVSASQPIKKELACYNLYMKTLKERHPDGHKSWRYLECKKHAIKLEQITAIIDNPRNYYKHTPKHLQTNKEKAQVAYNKEYFKKLRANKLPQPHVTVLDLEVCMYENDLPAID